MMHAASLLRQMLQEGKLTRKRVRGEPHWVTSDIIHRIITASLRDSIENGILSWDYILFHALLLCMQSALCARIGDITRSVLYAGNECLCYKDINVTLITEDGRERLWAVITLQFEKGMK